jgi:hypothetical protein
MVAVDLSATRNWREQDGSAAIAGKLSGNVNKLLRNEI